MQTFPSVLHKHGKYSFPNDFGTDEINYKRYGLLSSRKKRWNVLLHKRKYFAGNRGSRDARESSFAVTIIGRYRSAKCSCSVTCCPSYPEQE